MDGTTTIPFVQGQDVPTAAQVVTSLPTKHPAAKFKNVYKGLGIALMVVGFLSLILSAIAFTPNINNSVNYTGSGIWAGGWYIICGLVALVTGIRPNNITVIAGMIVCILASILAFSVVIFEIIFAVCTPYLYYYDGQECTDAFQIIHGLIAALNLLAFILTIVHSSFCCCCGSLARCRGKYNYEGRILTTTTTVMSAPNAQGQQFVGQPVAQQCYPQAQNPSKSQQQETHTLNENNAQEAAEVSKKQQY